MVLLETARLLIFGEIPDYTIISNNTFIACKYTIFHLTCLVPMKKYVYSCLITCLLLFSNYKFTNIWKFPPTYRISANSFRVNYSFLNLTLNMYCDLWSQHIQVWKLFKGGNYSRKYGMQKICKALFYYYRTLHTFVISLVIFSS